MTRIERLRKRSAELEHLAKEVQEKRWDAMCRIGGSVEDEALRQEQWNIWHEKCAIEDELEKEEAKA